MANENLDTTNKLIKPEDISPSDNEVIRQLSENLQDVTSGDIDAMCNELDEAKKIKEEEKLKIPQDLMAFRKEWESKIEKIDQSSKEKIIKASEKIPVKVETDSDGSRLIELKLGDKTRKILDPKLCNHTDIKYCNNWEDMNKVKLGGMRGGLGFWNNEKLRDYVGQKMNEGLYIPELEDVETLLEELGSMADLNREDDQIAMLMYLTGLNGCYRLAMKNNIARLRILCGFKARYDLDGVDEHEHNNLLMMSYDY